MLSSENISNNWLFFAFIAVIAILVFLYTNVSISVKNGGKRQSTKEVKESGVDDPTVGGNVHHTKIENVTYSLVGQKHELENELYN